MAKKGSSCIKIIVGGSSSSDEDSNLGESLSSSEPGARALKDEERLEDDNNDTTPSFILQPKEISKNIDLMKTVAMLMESKLKQSTRGIRTDEQVVIRELQNDIQRFPEAYQKFTSIIHQIQYLNVTSNWDLSNPEDNSNLMARPSSHHRGDVGQDEGGIITKVLRLKKRNNLPEDARKTIMLNLLTDLQQVFNRYAKIQTCLEEKLSKISQLAVKKLLNSPTQRQPERKPKANHFASIDSDEEEDDPQRPLLENASNLNYASFQEKITLLNEILQKTRRSSEEVQDSMDVLHELITWDYKQAVSGLSPSCSYQDSDVRISSEISSTHLAQNHLNNINDSFYSHVNNNNACHKRTWIVLATIAGIVILLIATMGLSLIRFNY